MGCGSSRASTECAGDDFPARPATAKSERQRAEKLIPQRRRTLVRKGSSSGSGDDSQKGRRQSLLSTDNEDESLPSSPVSPTAPKEPLGDDAIVAFSKYTKVGDPAVHANEDRLKVVPDLFANHAPRGVKYSGTQSRQVSYFGIYDGHGGSDVAEMLKHKLHKVLARNLYPANEHSSVGKVFMNTFLQTEQRYFRSSHAGSCCISILLKERSLYCANVGDSAALLIPYTTSPFQTRGKTTWLSDRHAVYLSKHEKKRLKRVGAEISQLPGLEDALVSRTREDREIYKAIYPTRCFGDADFKDLTRPVEALIAEPTGHGVGHEGPAVRLSGKGPWLLVVGCDGLWDFVTHSQIIKNIFKGGVERSLNDIAEGLVKLAQNPPANSDDDVSVIVTKIEYA